MTGIEICGMLLPAVRKEGERRKIRTCSGSIRIFRQARRRIKDDEMMKSLFESFVAQINEVTIEYKGAVLIANHQRLGSLFVPRPLSLR